jgi:hypothetical protein
MVVDKVAEDLLGMESVETDLSETYFAIANSGWIGRCLISVEALYELHLAGSKSCGVLVTQHDDASLGRLRLGDLFKPWNGSGVIEEDLSETELMHPIVECDIHIGHTDTCVIDSLECAHLFLRLFSFASLVSDYSCSTSEIED